MQYFLQILGEFSENVKAKLAELYLYELRRCKSKLHTSRVRKGKVSIFEPSRGFDTPLSMLLKNAWFLCRSHPRYP